MLEYWPNQQEPLEGVIPDDEVSQDPNLFDNDTDPELEMED
jgi:hypothetical protein